MHPSCYPIPWTPCLVHFHVHVHVHVHAHVPQVWEPLAAGSESLERDETQQDEIASPVLELFELDAAEVDLTLQPYGLGRQAVTIGVHLATPSNFFQVELKLGSGAAEAGWTIVEAYLGARKAGNWRYVSPRGLKFKTITQVVRSGYIVVSSTYYVAASPPVEVHRTGCRGEGVWRRRRA